MIVLLDTDASEDLRPLAAWLKAQGVPHRIWEEAGRLRLAVADPRCVSVGTEGVRRLRAGELGCTEARALGPALSPLRDAMRRRLLSSLLLMLTLLVFAVTAAGVTAIDAFVLRWLMIVPMTEQEGFIGFTTLASALRAGELWRLWTPALLHFGVLHLAFNLLWLWEFGGRLEIAGGRRRLFEAVVVIAPVANLAQYLLGEHPQFGGLSGVVYGLLGYLVVAGRRSAHCAWRLPTSLVVMLLVFLLFFSTGVTEPFGLHIANYAHWGGLVAGVLLALLRVPLEPQVPPASVWSGRERSSLTEVGRLTRYAVTSAGFLLRGRMGNMPALAELRCSFTHVGVGHEQATGEGKVWL